MFRKDKAKINKMQKMNGVLCFDKFYYWSYIQSILRS